MSELGSAPTTRRQRSRWELARRIIGAIWQHPANQRRRAHALSRAALWQLRKRLGRGPVVLSAYGLELHLPRSSGSLSNLMYFGEAYEWEGINFIRRYLRPGDVVVDVGANVGMFSYAAFERVGPEGQVHSIEPIPWASETILENAVINGISDRLRVHMMAVGATDGFVEFTDDLDVSNHMTWVDAPDISRSSSKVPMTTLDGILGRTVPLALVKLDVEGAERVALEGMVGHLEKGDPPVLLLEAHDHSLKKMGSSRREVMTFLDGYGYDVRRFDVSENRLIPPPKKWNGDVIAVHRQSLRSVENRLGSREDGADAR